MSITINIYYSGKNGNAKKFAEEMIKSGVVRKIREEEGNLRYEYFYPAEDTETVLLIDGWEDRAALDAHHASPMMEEIAFLREKYDLHMKAERYVSDENDLKRGRFFVFRKIFKRFRTQFEKIPFHDIFCLFFVLQIPAICIII